MENINTIAERIKTLRGKKTQRELASLLGVSPQAVSEWENGNKVPRMSMIEKISALYNVSKGYILGETDLMNRFDSDLTGDEQMLVENYRGLDRFGRDAVWAIVNAEYRRCETQKVEEDDLDKTSGKRLLPLYDYPASAGRGIFAGAGEYDLVSVPADAPMSVAFGIKISGRSMEPVIPDNSIVWVRPQSVVEDGEICIVTIDDEGYCKKKCGDSFASINPEYPTIFPTEDQRVTIAGKVAYIDIQN